MNMKEKTEYINIINFSDKILQSYDSTSSKINFRRRNNK